MSASGEKPAAKAKAIAEIKQEVTVAILAGIAVAAVLLIGGAGALHVLRLLIAALIVVLVVAARVVRRRRSRPDDATPAQTEEEGRDVWRRAEERYQASQRERDTS